MRREIGFRAEDAFARRRHASQGGRSRTLCRSASRIRPNSGIGWIGACVLPIHARNAWRYGCGEAAEAIRRRGAPPQAVPRRRPDDRGDRKRSRRDVGDDPEVPQEAPDPLARTRASQRSSVSADLAGGTSRDLGVASATVVAACPSRGSGGRDHPTPSARATRRRDHTGVGVAGRSMRRVDREATRTAITDRPRPVPRGSRIGPVRRGRARRASP